MSAQRNSSVLFQILAMALIYIGLRFFGGAASQLLYPVSILVTMFHELGHAICAAITGGQVLGIQINTDGSGFTTTQGGNAILILMGGYLGSAVFGNFLFYIGARRPQRAKMTLLGLAVLLLFAIIKWNASTTSSVLMLIAALTMIFIAYKTAFSNLVVLFFGMASVLYILQDFRTGPSSDLAAYESTVGIFPAEIWMYIWLFLVVILSWWNIRQIFGAGRFSMLARRSA